MATPKMTPVTEPCSESHNGLCIGWFHTLLRDAPFRARIYCKLKLKEAQSIEEFEYALDHYSYDEAIDTIHGDYGDWKVKLDSAESRVELADYSQGRLRESLDQAKPVTCARCGDEFLGNEEFGIEKRVICSRCYHQRNRDPRETRNPDIVARAEPDAIADNYEDTDCRANHDGWRKCRGALECDGTCWRGNPKERRQGELFTWVKPGKVRLHLQPKFAPCALCGRSTTERSDLAQPVGRLFCDNCWHDRLPEIRLEGLWNGE